MTWLIILGTITTILGLGGLGYCIREAARVKREGLTPEEAQPRLRALIAINLASVCVAAMGLGMVVVGVML
ncbi:hypothetical protein [Pontivivens ytuae]|uniref:Uncharacterized protein n=1 Tax=Pontivivens ytuae TaxID=2789856 RepID=A0A7S9QDA6_9RHOB|nr:hypothetical protein [Pontivivens ytuae]QPH54680.1 hypothetical protein I0K15_02550 [Pontivivens ytuae]